MYLYIYIYAYMRYLFTIQENPPKKTSFGILNLMFWSVFERPEDQGMPTMNTLSMFTDADIAFFHNTTQTKEKETQTCPTKP